MRITFFRQSSWCLNIPRIIKFKIFAEPKYDIIPEKTRDWTTGQVCNIVIFQIREYRKIITHLGMGGVIIWYHSLAAALMPSLRSVGITDVGIRNSLCHHFLPSYTSWGSQYLMLEPPDPHLKIRRTSNLRKMEW